MTDQTDKMTTLILTLTCERDELKKKLELERKSGKELYDKLKKELEREFVPFLRTFGQEMYVDVARKRDEWKAHSEKLEETLREIRAWATAPKRRFVLSTGVRMIDDALAAYERARKAGE